MFVQTADALQIKGLEKNNDLLSPYLGPTRLLSVPSHQVPIIIKFVTASVSLQFNMI
jgi:hypothetical protein